MAEAPPAGSPAIRTVAMPADTNPAGDIFGGWLMSQMDLAAGNLAALTARGRSATIAVEGMVFLRPVKVGDEVSLFAELASVGRTSNAHPRRRLAPQPRQRRQREGHRKAPSPSSPSTPRGARAQLVAQSEAARKFRCGSRAAETASTAQPPIPAGFDFHASRPLRPRSSRPSTEHE
jgi:acyl-CoA thioesterase YciA